MLLFNLQKPACCRYEDGQCSHCVHYRIYAAFDAEYATSECLNVQLCGELILPEVVMRERMMQVEQNIRITDTALNAVFCHIFNDRALTKLRLRRISADPRGLSSGNTFQSVLMR